MKPSELLADLTARGVILTRNGDKLGTKSPPGTLTAADRSNISRYKLALLALLNPTVPTLKDFAPTLNEIADGILDRMGFEVVQADADLYGCPWTPTLHVRPR